MPASAKQFLPFVREKFPGLANNTTIGTARNGYAPEEYRRKVSERVLRIRQEMRIRGEAMEGIRPTAGRAQLTLGWDAVAISGELERTRSCAAG